MADTVIKSVAIRNWATVREAEVIFPEHGLVLVRGVNTAAKGKMASIGSGKTALGEAISRALFEVKGRYTQLGNFSTNSKGNSYVKVVCEHKGKPLTVEMGFKCPELKPDGEGFRYQYDGNTVSRDTLDHTRSDLAKLLTVPTDLAAWTVYLDGDKLKFYDLSEKKAVELLMASLQQTSWGSFHKNANTTVSGTKNELDKHVAALNAAKAKLDEADLELGVSKQNLEEAKNVYAEAVKQNKAALKEAAGKVKAIHEAIAAKQARMEEIKKEIKRRTSLNAEKEHAFEMVVNENADAIQLLRDQLAELRTAKATVDAAVRTAIENRDDAKSAPDKCPTCGQKVACPDHAEIQKLEKKVVEAQKAQAAAAAAIQAKQLEVNRAVTAHQDSKKALQEAKAEAPIGELSSEYEDLEGDLQDENRKMAQAERERTRLEAGPDKTEVTRLETVVAEQKKQRVKLQKAVDTVAVTVTETEEALRVAEYWQEAFCPTGIPNMVLREAIGPLNTTARRISAAMTGGTISVSYATSRELASGKGERSELIIKVKNDLGSTRFEGSSKGESGLTELVVAETLAEVGGIAKRIGYRWYDEVCPNQDELVRRAIYAYLADIARRYKILVFLVTHGPEAASYADYVLIAEKTKEGTIYRWENR